MMKHGILGVVLGMMASLLISGLVMGSGYEKSGSAMQTEGATAGSAMMDNPAVLNLETDQIRELQSLLQDRGYNVGAIDGVLSPDTTEAIRQFQTDEGLAVTGTPNPETLRILAPSAEQQEFFGISPEFGGHEGMMEHKEMEEKMKSHY